MEISAIFTDVYFSANISIRGKDRSTKTEFVRLARQFDLREKANKRMSE